MLKSLSNMLSALYEDWTWLQPSRLKGRKRQTEMRDSQAACVQLTDSKFFEPIGVICLPAKCEASQLCDNHFSRGVDCPLYEVAASCVSSPIADRNVNVVPCICAVSKHHLTAACQRVEHHLTAACQCVIVIAGEDEIQLS